MRITILALLLTLGVTAIAPPHLTAADTPASTTTDPVTMLVGTWKISDKSLAPPEDASPEEKAMLAGMQAMFATIRLEFTADGTANMSAMGSTEVGSYTATQLTDNQVEVSITMPAEEGQEPQVETQTYTFENGEMHVAMNGETMIMERVQQP